MSDARISSGGTEESLPLRSAILKALQMGGTELLQNPGRLASYVLDLSDDEILEVRLATQQMDEKLLAPLNEALVAPSQDSLELARAKITDELTRGRLANATVAALTANSLAGGLADYLDIPLPPPQQTSPVAQTTQSPMHAQPIQPTQPPISAPPLQTNSSGTWQPTSQGVAPQPDYGASTATQGTPGTVFSPQPVASTTPSPQRPSAGRMIAYVLIGIALAVIIMVVITVTNQAGSSQTGTPSNGLTEVASSPYYVASSGGNVAIFAEGSASPAEVSDVPVSELSSDDANKLNAHMGAASMDEARKLVDGFRSSAKQNRLAKAPDPVFSDASADSTLPPDQYTSYYGARNLIDGNMNTAWNAADEGRGSSVSLLASSNQVVRGIKVVNGYVKSDEAFYSNCRAHDITITLSDGYSMNYALADLRNDTQTIEFDGYHEVTSIKITINSVYEGNRPDWNDLAITEISVFK